MITSISLLLALAAPPNPCIPVEGERVYARDVVPALRQFAGVPPDFPLGYAPVPGARRILTADSLRTVAKSQGVELESPRDVCFELRMAPLSKANILSAMVAAYGENPAAVRMDVLAWGPEVAPQGEIVFPRGALQFPSSRDLNQDVLWRGYVLYGANRRFSIWTRAHIAFSVTRVVAIADIEPGTPIREDQVQLATTEVGSPDARLARSIDEVVGYTSRKSVRPGASFLLSQLDRVPEVAKGDTVTVRVSEGAAQLVLSAEAQTAGSVGSVVWIKNPTSGKGFRARVTGKDTVAVTTLNGVPLQ